VHHTPKTGLRTALLIGTVALAAFNFSGIARADNVETVVVTGSRIPQPNLTSVSPVLSITNKEFQQKGATDVSDLLNDLPQTFVSNTGDFNNTQNPLSGPGGITTVDLRGLGAERTLVLVNGRRLGVGDPNTGNPGAAPDIDQIPVPLVGHVEVLTGGASATYGSDAVAGVVNFVMKKDFEGIQVDAQYGVNWHENTNSYARGIEGGVAAKGLVGPVELARKSIFDGRNSDASVIIGTNSADGRGNVTAYFVYRHADPVQQRNRDFSECQISQFDNADPTLPPSAACVGSSNSNLFQPTVDANQPKFSIVGNQALPRPQPFSVPAATFNANQFESLSRLDNRYNGGFFAHYDVNSWVKPYVEFSFLDDRSFTQIAPDAIFQGSNIFNADGSGNWLVNCDNPLLSAQEVSVFCTAHGRSGAQNTELNIGRRVIENGPRTSTYEHLNFRGVVGIQGDISDAWHYDAYGSYYYVVGDTKIGGFLSNQKVVNALQVVDVAGVPTCKSVVNGTDTACVPFNIFTQGGVTPAQLDYLREIGTSRGTLQEEILEADLTGDLTSWGIVSPFAHTGVQVSFGATNRKDKLVFQADQAEQSGDLLGAGGAQVPVNNAINVGEFYGEFRAPLAEDEPFIQELVLQGGLRFSDYTSGKRPTTWKSGLEWSPVSDIRFRTSYDVAIRAPSILETFTPNTVTNTSLVSVDPCAPTVDAKTGALIPATATLAQCQNTGVTAAEFGNGGTTDLIPQCVAFQCAVELGGNQALDPEKAKTFTVGFTTAPSFIDGFSASVDYFKIDIANAIVQGIGPTLELTNCLNTGNPIFCSNVVRSGNGSLQGASVTSGGFVKATFVNAAQTSNSGVDFQADYQTELADMGLGPNGGLVFHFVGTLTTTAKTTPFPGQPSFDCAGLYGQTCGSPLPTWRHVFGVTWETPWDFTFTTNWRFLGSSTLDSNSTQASLTNGNIDHVNGRIGDYSYIDLSGAWQFDDHVELRAGVTNVFDLDPPILDDGITGSGTPNTFNTYDLLGRSLFVAVTGKF